MKVVNFEHGQKVNYYTIQGFSHISPHGHKVWTCQCVCGTIKNVTTGKLTSGDRTNCGCISHANKIKSQTTHGQSNKNITPTYKTWQAMKARCQKPSNKNFPYYGARGITVCERWQKFANFFADMGERPDGKTLDRVDNLGNYEPSNCIWADAYQQSNNRRNTKFVCHQGKTFPMGVFARMHGIELERFRQRLKAGWSVERCLLA